MGLVGDDVGSVQLMARCQLQQAPTAGLGRFFPHISLNFETAATSPWMAGTTAASLLPAESTRAVRVWYQLLASVQRVVDASDVLATLLRNLHHKVDVDDVLPSAVGSSLGHRGRQQAHIR